MRSFFGGDSSWSGWRSIPTLSYLITDWLYLPHFQTELWYSICLFMTFSFSGLLLSVTSLYLVHAQLRARLGPLETGAARIHPGVPAQRD